jgi:hypothetical protein
MTLELHAPGRRPFIVATLREGEVLDGSWLVPPYRWAFDARALELPDFSGSMPSACATNVRPITISAMS